MLIPVVSDDPVRSGSNLGYLARNSLLSPELFEGAEAGVVQEQRPTAPEAGIFLPVFVDVETGRISRLVVVHQKHRALLDQKENPNAGAVLPGVYRAGPGWALGSVVGTTRQSRSHHGSGQQANGGFRVAGIVRVLQGCRFFSALDLAYNAVEFHKRLR
ncbi:unnamed protein product [Pseudo-nitzschia multistriata]|uniref:Uncharacterized protein n=1 Tax=Pseudo-nitzschia multistriata TaxID=183589 RepID=A0A448ZCE4_9STRA|nr:unnamed protein product [Pseudo-nitzschia multistriata]